MRSVWTLVAGAGLAGGVLALASASPTRADERFGPPGQLESGGSGVTAATVFEPGMRFPLESGPAYANSQVYRPGGMHGGAGGQCWPGNYSYPWHDTFCESRQWPMPMCPAGHGHQGQDIRPATCEANKHWAVAVEDGVIAQVGKYSVTLQTPSGALFRYLHLNMDRLQVAKFEHVTKGQRIGLVSNYFGGSSTTIHLHFDVKDTVEVGGRRAQVFVPPYTSLIAAYRAMNP